MCQKEENCHCGAGSSFIFGLILGVLAAGLAAVLLYRQDRAKVLEKLQKKLKDLLADNFKVTPSPESEPKPTVKATSKAKPKLFLKAK